MRASEKGRKPKATIGSANKKKFSNEKSWKAAFELKSRRMAMKRDNKIRAISEAIRRIGDSLSELKDATRLIKAQEAETSDALAHAKDALWDLHQRTNKCQAEIDECARNVAKLYVGMNSSAQHERHSGTRASPSGMLAETGGVGLGLPGSFESNKK
jgi:chromosome segregation ATPase